MELASSWQILSLMKHRIGFFTVLVFIASTSWAESNVRFAVIGDYGNNTAEESDVSNLVHSWNPDFVVTCGDNNYSTGSAQTIDANIGQYYHDFIYNYQGTYGPGSATMQFVPALGNHDWGNVANNPSGADPYLAYFTLPGNERYYNWRSGVVEFFVIDSDLNEPAGTSSTSAQAVWCQAAMSTSTAKWKIPVFHHPAYSSGQHQSTLYMRWPFQAWGATAVLQGHDHDYERLKVGDIPYFVNGIGGASLRPFGSILAQSQVRYAADFGAMLVTANAAAITFRAYSRTGYLIDSYTVRLSLLGGTSG